MMRVAASERSQEAATRVPGEECMGDVAEYVESIERARIDGIEPPLELADTVPDCDS